MKIKLHFGIITVLLALLGTFFEQNTAPNQQIVIQFSDDGFTVADRENAIETIQSQLRKIGVSQINIGQSQSGQLRITYFSEEDVAHIKDALFNAEDFKITYNSSNESSRDFPNKKNVKDYELNVSEIKTSTSNNWDLEGTQVTEFNHKTDHSNTLKVQDCGHQVNSELNNQILNTIITSYKVELIVSNNSSYKIPEVRAGPMV
ncbi:hypothetical protein [Winogradskyella endarachnes]|uniref:Uncharacterized protein n=1 Tax=Winogradskyella endarachnes TaxID=2681965 RepID=A0A6L6UEV1_9FLAO|nr:hypothetical protein [Winogradskyella endarachnes]MUU79462.1 hypothetical protein [Winogradskyella endarachnes]